MEFVIKKSDLVNELQTVTGVVEKRATLPILANLLIEAKDGKLHVGASDLEVTIRGTAAATVIQDGAVTLPASKLHEIARSLPDAEVQFKLQDRNIVSIRCERTRYKISGQPRDEFPNFPDIDLDKGTELPGNLLNELIERVAFSITTEDPRYSLNGALFQVEQGKLTLVATDSHRLAFVSSDVDVAAPEGGLRVIVPRKALAEVSKLTADLSDDDKIIFGKSENQVFFIVKGHRLTSNVLEGNFPNYSNVMPASCGTAVSVPTDEFSQAVRRVALLASDRYGRAVRLSLSNGKLDLFSKTEMGEAQESLNIDYDGGELSIGFNARYLQDFFNVVGSPSVRLELNPVKPGDNGDEQKPGEASDKPGQLRPDPTSEMDYRYIVMPMHL
jgi:DNA polymerase-3 subunit beta